MMHLLAWRSRSQRLAPVLSEVRVHVIVNYCFLAARALSPSLPSSLHAIFSVARNHPASSSGVLVQLEDNHQETAWVKEATSMLWAKSAGTPWGMSHTLRANSMSISA